MRRREDQILLYNVILCSLKLLEQVNFIIIFKEKKNKINFKHLEMNTNRLSGSN